MRQLINDLSVPVGLANLGNKLYHNAQYLTAVVEVDEKRWLVGYRLEWHWFNLPELICSVLISQKMSIRVLTMKRVYSFILK